MDKEQAKRAGQIVSEIDKRGEISKVLKKMQQSTSLFNAAGADGEYMCTIRDRKDETEVCHFVLTADELGTMILNEEKIIAKLESELEGL